MENVGGLARICVCACGNLTVDNEIINRAKLLPVPFTTDTGSRTCTKKREKNGDYCYDLAVKCKLPGTLPMEHLIASLPEEFVLITTDHNGVSRLDGRFDEPLHLEAESMTGEDFSDFNRVELTFTRKLRELPVVITL